MGTKSFRVIIPLPSGGEVQSLWEEEITPSLEGEGEAHWLTLKDVKGYDYQGFATGDIDWLKKVNKVV